MAKKALLLAILIVTAFSLIGCQTAKGIKGDVTFIGDKATEILDE